MVLFSNHSDDWMKANGFTDEEGEKREEKKRLQWGGATIADLELPVAVTVAKTTACKEAVEIMQSRGFDQLPVTGADGKLVGMVTLGHVLSKIACGRAGADDNVGKLMWSFKNSQGGPDGEYEEITRETLLENLSGFFEKNSAAVITEDGSVRHVATQVDLLAYLMKHQIKTE
jgi:cystathionine beta-synthase